MTQAAQRHLDQLLRDLYPAVACVLRSLLRMPEHPERRPDLKRPGNMLFNTSRFSPDERRNAAERAAELVRENGWSMRDACAAIAEEVGVAQWMTIRAWGNKYGIDIPYGPNYQPTQRRPRESSSSKRPNLVDPKDAGLEDLADGEEGSDTAEGPGVATAGGYEELLQAAQDFSQEYRMRMGNRIAAAIWHSVPLCVGDSKSLKELAIAHSILTDKRRLEEGAGTGGGRPYDEDDPADDLDSMLNEGANMLRVVGGTDQFPSPDAAPEREPTVRERYGKH